MTIESINEGEIISSKNPQFFGSAPQDTEIIITLGYAEEIKSPSLRDIPNYITFFNYWGNKTFPFKSHIGRLKQIIKRPFKK